MIQIDSVFEISNYEQIIQILHSFTKKREQIINVARSPCKKQQSEPSSNLLDFILCRRALGQQTPYLKTPCIFHPMSSLLIMYNLK